MACRVKTPMTCWKRLICTSTRTFFRPLAAQNTNSLTKWKSGHFPYLQLTYSNNAIKQNSGHFRANIWRTYPKSVTKWKSWPFPNIHSTFPYSPEASGGAMSWMTKRSIGRGCLNTTYAARSATVPDGDLAPPSLPPCFCYKTNCIFKRISVKKRLQHRTMYRAHSWKSKINKLRFRWAPWWNGYVPKCYEIPKE